ncbi:hypothetical protein TRAPUB_7911 [Trametes pubescens]|uniref:Uncharacterized protein n=1 Tax=Trametes pubescens TaxID=154538 RepID=A0A1M2V239_TRAPU|nr:hypothetical protein TRAPUB_7911 [Trametes pubescens]
MAATTTATTTNLPVTPLSTDTSPLMLTEDSSDAATATCRRRRQGRSTGGGAAVFRAFSKGPMPTDDSDDDDDWDPNDPCTPLFKRYYEALLDAGESSERLDELRALSDRCCFIVVRSSVLPGGVSGCGARLTTRALQFGGPREERAARALLPMTVRPQEEDTDDEDDEDEVIDAAPAQGTSTLNEGTATPNEGEVDDHDLPPFSHPTATTTRPIPSLALLPTATTTTTVPELTPLSAATLPLMPTEDSTNAAETADARRRRRQEQCMKPWLSLTDDDDDGLDPNDPCTPFFRRYQAIAEAGESMERLDELKEITARCCFIVFGGPPGPEEQAARALLPLPDHLKPREEDEDDEDEDHSMDGVFEQIVSKMREWEVEEAHGMTEVDPQDDED